MNTKTETEVTAKLDPLKWIAAIGLVAAGIYGYYHYDQYPVLYRVLVLIPVVIAALVLAVFTQGGNTFWELVKQARLEVYKVVWPTRQETTQTTMIVVLVVFIVAFILWILDMSLAWMASRIIG